MASICDLRALAEAEEDCEGVVPKEGEAGKPAAAIGERSTGADAGGTCELRFEPWYGARNGFCASGEFGFGMECP